MRSRISATVFLLLITSAIAVGQKSYTVRIDSLLAVKHPRPFNGVVAISRNGKMLYTKAYGYEDAARKKPMQLSDRFVTCSITKQVTAVLVLREIEKGHIQLHSPIHKYLPELTSTWADTVTIHQLLNHTSGVIAVDSPLAFRPGSQFAYSNLGYVLLAKITEHTSGKTYAKQAAELFSICGMHDTYIAEPGGNNPGLVEGHFGQEDGSFIPVRAIIPELPVAAAGMISTAADLVSWNEHLHNGKLLSPISYKRMITPSSRRQHPVFGDVGCGYGVIINKKHHIVEIGHTGFLLQQGFTTIDVYYPANGTSIVVLENYAYSGDNWKKIDFYEIQARRIMAEVGVY